MTKPNNDDLERAREWLNTQLSHAYINEKHIKSLAVSYAVLREPLECRIADLVTSTLVACDELERRWSRMDEMKAKIAELEIERDKLEGK